MSGLTYSELQLAAVALLTDLGPLNLDGLAAASRARLNAAIDAPPVPIPMRITCPDCGALHIDEGEWATRVHHTHSCQGCGLTWRPAVVPTVGVRFLPGFKNEPPARPE